jgi:hypothetical protein
VLSSKWGRRPAWSSSKCSHFSVQTGFSLRRIGAWKCQAAFFSYCWLLGFAGDWISTSEVVSSVVMLQISPYESDGLSSPGPAVRRT